MTDRTRATPATAAPATGVAPAVDAERPVQDLTAAELDQILTWSVVRVSVSSGSASPSGWPSRG